MRFQSMASAQYLPSVWSRVLELKTLFFHILAPPAGEFRDGDVLVVLDAIRAYATLFDDDQRVSLARLVQTARGKGIPVVFTRWKRVDKSLRDAVDAKGHWSDYVSAQETDLLIVPEREDVLADVFFTNAFTSEAVCQAVRGRRRLVLAGGWLESCVTDTARVSMQRGMDVTVVVKSATVGHSWAWYYSWMQLQMLYADVVSCISG